MRHPMIKNTLWLLLLITFTFATFQPLWLEVAHQLSHLGDEIHHHHFHDHGADHSHEQLAYLVNHAADPEESSPFSTNNIEFKRLVAVVPTLPVLSFPDIYQLNSFPTSSNWLHSIFLECESPPPDQSILAS